MSIQFMVPGFELTTLGMRVSSHNLLTTFLLLYFVFETLFELILCIKTSFAVASTQQMEYLSIVFANTEKASE